MRNTKSLPSLYTVYRREYGESKITVVANYQTSGEVDKLIYDIRARAARSWAGELWVSFITNPENPETEVTVWAEEA